MHVFEKNSLQQHHKPVPSLISSDTLVIRIKALFLSLSHLQNTLKRNTIITEKHEKVIIEYTICAII
jgi:hypothetical protein